MALISIHKLRMTTFPRSQHGQEAPVLGRLWDIALVSVADARDTAGTACQIMRLHGNQRKRGFAK